MMPVIKLIFLLLLAAFILMKYYDHESAAGKKGPLLAVRILAIGLFLLYVTAVVYNRVGGCFRCVSAIDALVLSAIILFLGLDLWILSSINKKS